MGATSRSVFGARGAASRCFCQRYKLAPRESFGRLSREERAARLREQAGCDDPGSGTSGLVAHLDGEPVGWCAVEPRPAFGGLVRNAAVPWVRARRGPGRRRGLGRDLPAHPGRLPPTWREPGLARAAVEHARAEGARALEAYPMTTTAAIAEELHVGTVATFAAAGLTEVGRPRPPGGHADRVLSRGDRTDGVRLRSRASPSPRPGPPRARRGCAGCRTRCPRGRPGRPSRCPGRTARGGRRPRPRRASSSRASSVVAAALDRLEVEVDAVLPRLGLGHLDEEQPVRAVAAEDHALLVAGEVGVALDVDVVEHPLPPLERAYASRQSMVVWDTCAVIATPSHPAAAPAPPGCGVRRRSRPGCRRRTPRAGPAASARRRSRDGAPTRRRRRRRARRRRRSRCP